MAILTFRRPLLLFCLCGFGSPFPRKLAQTDEQDEQHSSCQTSGPVLEGERATIFCSFSRPNQDFQVYRLTPSNGSDTTARKPSISVVCPRSGEKCHLSDGHTVTTTSNIDQATIEIESVTQEHAGEYFCKTQPAANDHATSCTLTVQSNTVRRRNLVTCKTGSQVQVGQEASVVCEFSKRIGGTGITLTKHGTSPGEIMNCDEKRQCELKKEGYAIVEKTDTFVKLSIPSAKSDHAGDYVCSAAQISGLSSRCTLDVMQVLPENDVDSDETTPTAIILVICVILIIIAVVLLAATLYLTRKHHVWCRNKSNHSRDNTSPSSTSLFLPPNEAQTWSSLHVLTLSAQSV
ncbi:uncharacterized protein [Littorina saxatilis]|uniref:Ig-like domain-containing protein n=1 Tax=Littorina saxatilis TaxID=31220 RepID=A0AAN9BJ55_9CAEN